MNWAPTKGTTVGIVFAISGSTNNIGHAGIHFFNRLVIVAGGGPMPGPFPLSEGWHRLHGATNNNKQGAVAMEPMNPYQAPAADVSAIPTQGGVDESSPFSPKGRFGRLSYIAWGMLLGIAGWGAVMVFGGGMAAMGPDSFATMGPLVMVLQLVLLVPMILFAIRRLHDFDATGWWSLLFIVPIVNAIFGLVLVFKGGTDGANRFAPPRVTRGWERVLGFIGIGFMVLGIIGVIAAVAIPSLMR
jgi:uncharacterized membrane protein YhaH (DUF805 family)